MNPKSGGGKVERFHLEDEASRRGIEPVVLTLGDDLAQLASDAIARGADVIGMAGGDGSQALVAGVAYRHVTLRSSAARPGPATTWRWTSAWIAKTSWALSTRSETPWSDASI